ncbi:ectoine synthase [Pseudonocardia alni]|jgi:L-ectoine synthase|uniref:L-ectoine synthase n=2 Tax=Pseudonocardia alni TaxID=33907 RepID=A0A852WA84_PSEA5|nr:MULTISPECIES: ectoine synthase [Pseudonocardia]OJG05797.1 L-ectoine synthase [Pseudonocardia autotrophica]ALE79363.1 L-ectoine synthase [Pseudonocardia sp. AL041005-10]MCO7195767.1 ectoine synthase [Pseudonocardia sp. McavD-2-B]MYW74948.1 L-ectoine synthase [Pseudonocardia sp. SID8383]NYG03245.1 L-ectoine synthase [Pseudonocardia antarctica]
MIVRTIDEITDTERDVVSEDQQWRSKRIVLANDKVGFSVHETTLKAGTINDFWYANHIEAVFITSGEGELYDKDNDVTYQLKPGSIYVLNGNEKHQLRPKTEITCVCVFNPPVTGREVHDENGVYPLVTED